MNPSPAFLLWCRPAAAALVAAWCVCLSAAATAQDSGNDADPGEAFREALQRVMIPNTYLTNGPQVRAAFRDAVADAVKATVRIRSGRRDLALGGIVGPDGWIVTKASELKGDLVCKLHDGREFPAEIVGVDRQFDLAVLKIEAKNLPVLALKRDTDADVGEWIATISTRPEPIAVGVVSVDTRRIRRQPGTLGVQFEDAPEGARVVQVYRDTAAAAAGVQVNDIIVSVSGVATPTGDALRRAIANHSPGDAIDLEIRRDQTTVALRAVLTGRVPAMQGTDRRDYQNSLGSELSSRRFGFEHAFQHDTVLAPNDCGGPVVDLEGRVVGFNIARSGRTESYAIPSNVVITRLYDLMSGNLAPKPIEEPQAEPANPHPEPTKSDATGKAPNEDEAEAESAQQPMNSDND